MRIEDFIILSVILFVSWFLVKKKQSSFTDHIDAPKNGAALKLLEANEYNIVNGKHRVPIDVETSDRKYQTRIMIDFVVEKDNAFYVVKLKNKRVKESFSGSFLRDELLILQLFFRVDGVLYIDTDKEKINKIIFEYPNMQYKKSFTDYFRFPKWLLVMAAISVLIFILR